MSQFSMNLKLDYFWELTTDKARGIINDVDDYTVNIVNNSRKLKILDVIDNLPKLNVFGG